MQDDEIWVTFRVNFLSSCWEECGGKAHEGREEMEQSEK